MKSLSGSLPSPTQQAPGRPALIVCAKGCLLRDGSPLGADILVTRNGQVVAYCAPCATRLQMTGGSS